MPYSTIDELPAGVRGNLPPHAQEIYRAAFNNAWERYADPAMRHGQEPREEAAHRVAWAAVEKSFVKDPSNGRWRKR